ncbi:YtxH domain-containing protein [Actinomadura sp. HBU206391]|uniref:YtxH domain-containing protein n=1 Tax=Actinomadura sp. HBU206391 TaxID=2731692 RepID=UPI00164F4954|nr:YtxH domain-containing protein [Actinomadura sp. HBU206391]MBC6463629.1 YtxH domain-containing protein [Actinomadura sp. HBU206391]
MKYKATFIAGTAVGYLLGTRAGRERYEQIRRAYRRIAENPTVQETAGVVRAQVGTLGNTAKETVRSTLQDTIGDRLPGSRRTGDEDASAPPPTETTLPYR